MTHTLESSDREGKITVSNTLKALMEKGDNMHDQSFQQRGGNLKEESNGSVQKEKHVKRAVMSSVGWSVDATQLSKESPNLKTRQKS